MERAELGEGHNSLKTCCSPGTRLLITYKHYSTLNTVYPKNTFFSFLLFFKSQVVKNLSA